LYIVAVDPGREKCGLAVLSPEGEVREQRVVSRSELFHHLAGCLQRYGVFQLVVGDRTGSKELIAEFDKSPLSERVPPVRRVDEHLSSHEARLRYFRDHPPRGWRRLIPRTMLTPAEPYDDYVAVILAERYLAAEQAPDRGKGQ